MNTDQPESLFIPEGDSFVPTPATAGVWHPLLLHGGAVAALMAQMLESAAAPGMTPMRLAIDFIRPVPMAPLTPVVRTVRQGRRSHLLEAELSTQGAVVARGNLLCFAPATDHIEANSHFADAEPLDAPADFELWDPNGRRGRAGAQFMSTGLEVRVPSAREFAGARAGWFRLKLPVTPGVTPSPMVRVAAAADNSSGLALFVTSEETRHTAVLNADLVIHTARPMVGEWLRIEAGSRWNAARTGLAHGELSDTQGPVGVSQQTLAIERREAS